MNTATAQDATTSARILAHLSAGGSLEDAFDCVLGPGRYEGLVDGLYQELRQAGGAPPSAKN